METAGAIHGAEYDRTTAPIPRGLQRGFGPWCVRTVAVLNGLSVQSREGR
jgi:hypothetical protein